MLGKTFMAISIVLAMGYGYYNTDNWVVVIGIILLFVVAGIDWIFNLED